VNPRDLIDPTQDRKDKQATAISLSFVKVVFVQNFHLD
jgi:hypothetical protein